MTDDELYLDPTLRIVGAVVRRAIIDGHPKQPRHGKLSCGDQAEAQQFAREALAREGKAREFIERYWSLPYKEARAMMGNE
jgi:hypothetical protein